MKNLIIELQSKVDSKRKYLQTEVCLLLDKIINHQSIDFESKSELIQLKASVNKIHFEYWNRHASNEEAFVLINHYVKKALEILKNRKPLD